MAMPWVEPGRAPSPLRRSGITGITMAGAVTLAA